MRPPVRLTGQDCSDRGEPVELYCRRFRGCVRARSATPARAVRFSSVHTGNADANVSARGVTFGTGEGVPVYDPSHSAGDRTAGSHTRVSL